MRVHSARSGGKVMKRYAQALIIAAAPLLLAAIWMDDQPSPRPYRAPILSPPAGSVPFSAGGAAKPVPSTPESVAAGKALFEINCALCHGQTSAKPGPVGSKLTPPPPTLAPSLVRGLPDNLILTAIANGFGRMPPFRDKLTPAERQQLLHFLRTRN